MVIMPRTSPITNHFTCLVKQDQERYHAGALDAAALVLIQDGNLLDQKYKQEGALHRDILTYLRSTVNSAVNPSNPEEEVSSKLLKTTPTLAMDFACILLGGGNAANDAGNVWDTWKGLIADASQISFCAYQEETTAINFPTLGDGVKSELLTSFYKKLCTPQTPNFTGLEISHFLHLLACLPPLIDRFPLVNQLMVNLMGKAKPEFFSASESQASASASTSTAKSQEPVFIKEHWSVIYRMITSVRNRSFGTGVRAVLDYINPALKKLIGQLTYTGSVVDILKSEKNKSVFKEEYKKIYEKISLDEWTKLFGMIQFMLQELPHQYGEQPEENAIVENIKNVLKIIEQNIKTYAKTLPDIYGMILLDEQRAVSPTSPRGARKAALSPRKVEEAVLSSSPKEEQWAVSPDLLKKMEEWQVKQSSSREAEQRATSPLSPRRTEQKATSSSSPGDTQQRVLSPEAEREASPSSPREPQQEGSDKVKSRSNSWWEKLKKK